MKKNLSNHIFIILVFLLVFTGISRGQDIDKYQELVDKVGSRLVATVDADTLNLKYKFAPKFYVIESQELNAAAGADKDNKEYIVVIYTQLLKDVIQDSEDRLAYVLAHELSHITCRHVDKGNFEQPETTNETFQLAFSREDEFEADAEGFKLMVIAGFSHKGAIEIFKKMRELSGDNSSIEANGVDHPTFTDRLALVDKEKANIWRAMSSFSTGVELLLFEQYEAAAVCFEKVANEFPDSYEALNNLGYAKLMRYFDAFELEDLKEFNIGQIVVGGFYSRPISLEEKVKGFNEKLWWEAIGHFKDALRLNPNLSLSLVKANLGMAYLLDPRQKSKGESQKYFSEALEQIESDTTLDPLQKAVIYINAGNLGLAELNFEKASKNLDRALDYINNVRTDDIYFAGKGPNSVLGIRYSKAQINDAISLNRYLIKTKNFSELDDLNGAVNFLMTYLKNSDRSSIWWNYCYSLYSDLCKQSQTSPLDQSKIKTTRILPPAKSIVLEDGTPIFLSQKISEVNSKINYNERIPIVPERKFYKYIYSDLGFEIVGGEYVIAIIIKNAEQADKIKIPFFDEKKFDYSFLGLKKSELPDAFDKKDLKVKYFMSDDEYGYIFCYELGIAYLIEKGIVKGFIIVEPPRDNN